jgi:hypothetical protein
VIVYAVVDDSLQSPSRSRKPSRRSSDARTPSGSSRRCAATTQLANYLRVVEREVEAGKRN